MSDTANSQRPGAGGQGPGTGNRRALARIITALVIFLCIVACTLTFLLPADSLVVDLIYQGF